MPRAARKLSSTGVYHVIFRGINRQQIFEDEEDCIRFMNTLLKYQQECEYIVYGYCLMGNHIHLLLKEGRKSLSEALKRVAGSYVRWYNSKYQRTGHLFQDRFKSEAVENDGYLLTVLRYIHMNPVKAGLCKDPGAYKYSSYCEYLGESGIVDPQLILSMISLEQYVEYHQQKNDDHCLDDEGYTGLGEKEAKSILDRITGGMTPSDFQRLPIDQRNEIIKKIYRKGLSVRQISRLTGLSIRVVDYNKK